MLTLFGPGDPMHFLEVDKNFMFTHIPLANSERWYQMCPDFGKHMCAIIWSRKSPLPQLYENVAARSITSRLQYESLGTWISPYSTRPMSVSSAFLHDGPELAMQSLDCSDSSLKLLPVQAFIVVVNYVDRISSIYATATQSPRQHLVWHTDGLPPPDDEPHQLIRADLPVAENVAFAVTSLMRHPSPYDGGDEYSYERVFDSSLRMLFDDCQRFHVDSVHSDPSEEAHFPPCIVTCSEWNAAEASRMASVVHPTLLALINATDSNIAASSGLPDYCFVYGLHWTSDRLRIIIHFPLIDEKPDTRPLQWTFYQIVLAEHWVNVQGSGVPPSEGSFPPSEDEAFLFRWRLVIALLTVHSHTKQIQRILSKRAPQARTIKQSLNDSAAACSQRYIAQNISLPATTGAYLQDLQSNWSQCTFSVPEDWIPTDEFAVKMLWPRLEDDHLLRSIGYSWQLVRQLTKVYLYPIRSRLTAAPDVNAAGLDTAPNFRHPSFHPRTNIYYRKKALKNYTSEEWESEAHLYKLHDMLSMATTDWRFVSTYMAHCLSGFRDYTLIWDPIFENLSNTASGTSKNHDLGDILVDFVLVPTLKIELKQRSQTRLLENDPVVFLGLRATAISSHSGNEVTSGDLEALKRVLLPYVERRARPMKVLASPMSEGFLDDDMEDYRPTTEESLLFGTYIKPGVVHILAFRETEDPIGVDIIVLDSLPVSKVARNEQDILNRLRLCIALFTLQRHAARFCQKWNTLRFFYDDFTNSSVSRESQDVPRQDRSWETDAVADSIDSQDERDADIVERKSATWWEIEKRNAFIASIRRGKDLQHLQKVLFVEKWVDHVSRGDEAFVAAQALAALDSDAEERKLMRVFGAREWW